jgi:hypothetical protein
LSSLAGPLLAALAIPLAYVTARQLGQEKEARLAAALVSTMPALLLFAPLADQSLAFMSLLSLLLLVLAWRRRSAGLHFAAGLVISLASYASLGTLALLVVPAVVLGLRFWRATLQRRALLGWSVALALGAGFIWAAGWVLTGVAPWEIARTAMDQHYELVTSRREYGLWLGFNALDLFIFAGPVVFLGFAGAAVSGLSRMKERDDADYRDLSLSLAVLIIALLVSGVTRGEVGRIWLFLMPLMAILAGVYLVGRWPDKRATLLLVGLQLALVVSLGLAWRPVEAVIVRAQRPVMAAVPVRLVEAEAVFEDNLVLAGHALEAERLGPGGELQLTLLWRADGPSQRAYTVFTHIVDGSGDVVAQYDGWPVHGQWPATCWQAGEAVVDPISVSLPADVIPGDYQLLVGLYDAGDGQRLPLVNGDDAYKLATLEVK